MSPASGQTRGHCIANSLPILIYPPLAEVIKTMPRIIFLIASAISLVACTHEEVYNTTPPPSTTTTVRRTTTVTQPVPPTTTTTVVTPQ